MRFEFEPNDSRETGSRLDRRDAHEPELRPRPRRQRRQRPGHFQSLAAEQAGEEALPVALASARSGGGGVAARAFIKVVTANYFDVLGVGAALGRTFLPQVESSP